MRKYRIAAVFAAFLLALSFCNTAYATEIDETPDEPTETADIEIPLVSPEPTVSKVKEYAPFTPAGAATVVDNATTEDGKEFFTITTPNKNVFYLIIDRQRGSENVYFLNAVTEKDLLALAECSEDMAGDSSVSAVSGTSTVAPVQSEPAPEPSPEPVSKPDNGGDMGMMIFIAVAVLVGGGAGYYFKIYRPKRQADDSEEDYDYSSDDEPNDDGPPWLNRDESYGDGEE